MIHVNNIDHGQQIMRSIDSGFSEVTMQVISRSENGILRGGVVYENWSGKGGSCLVHTAGFDHHWIDRDMLFVMFDYPFKQLECNKVFAQIREKNEVALKFNLSMGFKEIITLQDVYPDDNMVLTCLSREDCRYLNIKPRKVSPKRSNDG